VSSAGSPGEGFGKFAVFVTTGSVLRRPDCMASWFIHAPPRLLGRAKVIEIEKSEGRAVGIEHLEHANIRVVHGMSWRSRNVIPYNCVAA
jgi:hypothetical protein